MTNLKFLFRDFSFTDFSCARQSKQAFSALAFEKFSRFSASCCFASQFFLGLGNVRTSSTLHSTFERLSIGCIARYAPSFCAAI